MQKVLHDPAELEPAEQRALAAFSRHYSAAETYRAYHVVHRAVSQPFRTDPPRVVFLAALFLATRLAAARPPEGVSLASVLFVLAQEAERQQAWKVARTAYLKLQSLRVRFTPLHLLGFVQAMRVAAALQAAPRVQLLAAWQARVEVASVLINAKPLRDDERLARACPRCGAALPLLGTSGDACASCGAAVVRCFATFEPLPLVEFELAEGITDEQAEALIAAEPRTARLRCGAQACTPMMSLLPLTLTRTQAPAHAGTRTGRTQSWAACKGTRRARISCASMMLMWRVPLTPMRRPPATPLDRSWAFRTCRSWPTRPRCVTWRAARCSCGGGPTGICLRNTFATWTPTCTRS